MAAIGAVPGNPILPGQGGTDPHVGIFGERAIFRESSIGRVFYRAQGEIEPVRPEAGGVSASPRP